MELHDDQGQPLTGPTEMDCDCGIHHVIDPEAIERLMAARKFRCYACRKRLHGHALASIVSLEHGRLAGVCARCNRMQGGE